MNRLGQFALALVLTLISLQASFSSRPWDTRSPIAWDVCTYYSYLPMGFVHHRYEKKVWNLEEDHKQIGYYTDSLPPKMTMGMAISWFPAFMVAHTTAESLGHKPDGISLPYKVAIHFSLYLYLFWGWWALIGVWNGFRFGPAVQMTGAALLLLGTNLLYYTADETALSHGLNFVLVSMLLHQSMRWWERLKTRHLYAIAALLGYIVLIRPSNAIFAAIPLIMGLNYYPPAKLLTKIPLRPLLIAVVIGLLMLTPQLIFWKIFHGEWLVYSYGEEGFFWSDPQILNGLFSYRKGWFLYTPLGLFMLIGMVFFARKHPRMGVWLAVFIMLFIYVVFSWWCWWYGGSFGQRVMIDLYPVLSLGLLSLITWAFARLFRAIVAVAVASIIICFSALQTFQYRDGLIHNDGMSKCSYAAHFMQWKAPKQYWWHTLYMPDYEAAKKGKDVYPPETGWEEYCNDNILVQNNAVQQCCRLQRLYRKQ